MEAMILMGLFRQNFSQNRKVNPLVEERANSFEQPKP